MAKVKPGEGSEVDTRSEVTLKDEDTKFKTEIDGDKMKNESRVLKKEEHIFKLGNLEQIFRYALDILFVSRVLTISQQHQMASSRLHFLAQFEGDETRQRSSE